MDVKYTYAPQNSSNAQFYWDTSDPEIIRVYGNRFRGLKEGTAELIITTLDKTFEKRVKVTVKDTNKIKVNDVITDQQEYNIKLNEAADIGYTYEPINSSNAEFYWDSSDSEIIRVWGNRIRGLKVGTAEIIITTLDGTFEKRIKVIVTSN